jgi:hypothetical protein
MYKLANEEHLRFTDHPTEVGRWARRGYFRHLANLVPHCPGIGRLAQETLVPVGDENDDLDEIQPYLAPFGAAAVFPEALSQIVAADVAHGGGLLCLSELPTIGVEVVSQQEVERQNTEYRPLPQVNHSSLIRFALNDVHIRALPDRPFICIFRSHDCDDSLESALDWNLHANLNRMELVLWRCDINAL